MAIGVGRPAVDHVACRPSKITYDTRKLPKKVQGNPTCTLPNLRWTTTWTVVGRQPHMGQVFSYAKSHVHMLRKNDPYDTRKHPKNFQGDPIRSPGGRPRGSPSIENQ
ncbi:uncharacterized protein G2W53_027118 [Senna tora]|uniref:Uncharacterized protein n=1 Tax=Senna tora TaxID=362788 RepID=A0A834TGJ3_9FABA|nr:uncharacterized protein G2W53_027118 [Senna tora]